MTGPRGESGQCVYPVRCATASDLRERLVVAGEEVERLRNRAAASHALTEHSRLAGKADGIALALSYLDEMTPSGGPEGGADRG